MLITLAHFLIILIASDFINISVRFGIIIYRYRLELFNFIL